MERGYHIENSFAKKGGEVRRGFRRFIQILNLFVLLLLLTGSSIHAAGLGTFDVMLQPTQLRAVNTNDDDGDEIIFTYLLRTDS